MQTIEQMKQLAVTQTPLLLFECTLPSGVVERWSTHRADVNGYTFAARVLRHNLFEFRAGSEEGVDTVSRVTLVLANADSHFSQIQRAQGWKGAKLRAFFSFYDLKQRCAASDSRVLFQGICNPPDEITESTMRLTFTSRMNLQRILLPQVRVQRRCPWIFPGTEAQRAEAVNGGVSGSHSPFFRCGYSADQPGGCGNLAPNGAYTSCDYTRGQCIERGMFEKDNAGRTTSRFGGIEFVPSSISVKTYGESGGHVSSAVENESKYNDFVPLVYGTAWYRPPVVFARNDGNLTRMEVLLGMGEIEGVLKVVVNGIELPAGADAHQATATGWYNLVTHGERCGGFNLDFTENGKPAGDPYGSMAMLAVVVPNRVSDGAPIPRIEVLLQGLRLATFSEDGESTAMVFSNNPAWVLLDLLRRSGWNADELDVRSFARTAAYCAEPIETSDLNGNTRSVPRFGCNVVLRRRRSAADVIRGVRNGAGLYLTYGSSGLLELHPESSFAIQHPELPAGSNSTEMLAGGWPVYEFGDGSSPFSDILRRDNGEPAVRVWCRSTAETPNRFTVEFQDEFNEYQQDSLSLVDLEDSMAAGQEVSASLAALGLPNFNQAGRVMRLALDRSIRGNTYIDFETGLRSIGIKPGDLITVSYAKEGLVRQPFRVIRVSPGANFQTAAMTAQWHDDQWYTGAGGTIGLVGGGRQPAMEIGVPRPLGGSRLGVNGEPEFEMAERYQERADGTWEVAVEVKFASPARISADAPGVPLISLAADVSGSGGTLHGGRSYYYAVTGVDAQGLESPLSFVVRAFAAAETDTNQVRLKGLSFSEGTAKFHVYRGSNPAQLFRIAEAETVADEFADTGLSALGAAPPDRNYHHANFYWRQELLPPAACTTHTPVSIGNDTLGMLAGEYRGKVVRITSGKGSGQERIISDNDRVVITVSKAWDVEPDETSEFAAAEAGWNFGSVTESSPVRFSVPNRQKSTIHVTGRSANVNDRECSPELSPLTRHTIGGAAEDPDVPLPPRFGLQSTGRGTVELTGIGFDDLECTSSITAASLTLHVWDELKGIPVQRLTNPIDAATDTVALTDAAAVHPGALLQVGSELVVAQSAGDDGVSYEVQRGAYGSTAASHDAGTPVFELERKVSVMPFVKGFFGDPASGSYGHLVTLPNARIGAAELFVTNARGNSQVTGISYAHLEGGGIRTLSGGQITLQVEGALSIQSEAVPPLASDTKRAVRDVFGTLGTPAAGGPVSVRVTAGGQPYCDLTFGPGNTVSDVVDGCGLPILDPRSPLGLEIMSIPQGANTASGAGLTVTIRF